MLERLIASAGQWQGSSVLHDPNTGKPEESRSTMTIERLLDGRFIRMDYTWGYQGTPQSGSLLIGYKKAAGLLTGHWIDSWHNGESVMALEGKAADSGDVVLRGSYPAPPGPDWGWRIAVTPNGNELKIVMHNIFPDGKEEPAVEGRYSR